MFTGIIEATGKITRLKKEGGSLHVEVQSSLSAELKVDQSVSHNGACLTVVKVEDDRHTVVAVAETLRKTNMGNWQTGTLVNLERSLLLNGRLDGHLVQGHVDATATCIQRVEDQGSWQFRFRFPESFAPLVVEKGSICLNGISLTVFDVEKDAFSVVIIPYTFDHTNIHLVQPGDAVNLEFDLIGKYVARQRAYRP